MVARLRIRSFRAEIHASRPGQAAQSRRCAGDAGGMAASAANREMTRIPARDREQGLILPTGSPGTRKKADRLMGFRAQGALLDISSPCLPGVCPAVVR